MDALRQLFRTEIIDDVIARGCDPEAKALENGLIVVRGARLHADRHEPLECLAVLDAQPSAIGVCRRSIPGYATNRAALSKPFQFGLTAPLLGYPRNGDGMPGTLPLANGHSHANANLDAKDIVRGSAELRIAAYITIEIDVENVTEIP